MPRRPVLAECKICGGSATVKHHRATGANGRVYFYEVFVHRNGTSHYFRSGGVSGRRESMSTFQEIVDRRMNNGKYRFKEIKSLLESIRGTKVSNTNVHRNLERAMRSNLVQRKTENGIILYSKRVKDVSESRRRITQAIMTLSISDAGIAMTTLLRFDNDSEESLKGLTFTMPVGSLNNLHEIDLEIYDHLGKISKSELQIAYSYAGQTGILINFNRHIGPSESGFLFIENSFKTRDSELKVVLPLDVGSLRIHVTGHRERRVSIRKRLLDGIKETYPDYITRGSLVNDRVFTEAEFENASKGDTIVISLEPKGH